MPPIAGPKVYLQLPTDPILLQAAGRVAFAHANLEHVLRMTIKTLLSCSVNVALNATSSKNSLELRKEIRKLAKKRIKDDRALAQLEALLKRAQLATERRNELMHRPVARNDSGALTVKTEDHEWGPPPTVSELDNLANDIGQVAIELNHSRRKGFLHDALRSIERPPFWTSKSRDELIAEQNVTAVEKLADLAATLPVDEKFDEVAAELSDDRRIRRNLADL